MNENTTDDRVTLEIVNFVHRRHRIVERLIGPIHEWLWDQPMKVVGTQTADETDREMMEAVTATPELWSAKKLAERLYDTISNGVLCSPPEDEHGFPIVDSPTERNYCGPCKTIWKQIEALRLSK